MSTSANLGLVVVGKHRAGIDARLDAKTPLVVVEHHRADLEVGLCFHGMSPLMFQVCLRRERFSKEVPTHESRLVPR